MALNPVSNNFGGLDLFGLTQDIALAGLVMILFLTANVIAQSVRERLPEFATLKTIGFSRPRPDRAGGAGSGRCPAWPGAGLGVGLAAFLAASYPRVFPAQLRHSHPTISPMVFAVGGAQRAGAGLCQRRLARASPEPHGYRHRSVGTHMNSLRQIWIVSRLNFRNLPRRGCGNRWWW